jgi:hypothetical protein
MAKRIKAIKEYTPTIKQLPTLTMDRLVGYIAARTNMNEGAVHHLLMELRDTIIFFGLMGQAVKLEGIGTFTPTLQLDGTINMNYRADKYIKQRLNDTGKLSADIRNKEMLGKTVEDLIAQWNKNHPDDIVED